MKQRRIDSFFFFRNIEALPLLLLLAACLLHDRQAAYLGELLESKQAQYKCVPVIVEFHGNNPGAHGRRAYCAVSPLLKVFKFSWRDGRAPLF